MNSSTGCKEPWNTPEGKKIWKTEADYWTWLRGAIRRLWSDYPVRKEWKTRQLRPVSQEEKSSKKFHPSTKNVGQCYYCKVWLAGSKLECDHKEASEGCTSKETAESFLWHCGGGVGSDWVLSCKPCHKIKSYAEEWGMTMEKATAEKGAIAIINSKEDKRWLKDKGIKPASNVKGRRSQIVEYLLNQNKGE